MSKTINYIKREDVEMFKHLNSFPEIDRDNALDMYQKIAQGSAIYPGKGQPMGLVYCALKLNGEAGELAEHVGKALRDDDYGYGSPMKPERREAIIKEIGDGLWYLAAICSEFGLTLSEVAAINLDKLCSRGERGVLQGSGDNR